MLTILISLGIASATPSFDTPLELPQIADRAERIVQGEILLIHTEQENQELWTVATVRVNETLRGVQTPVVSVRIPGGSLPGGDLTVYGGARLMQGHEVLLFLDGDQIVGMGQGVFVVDQDRAWRGNRPWVMPHPGNLNAKSGDDSLYTAHDLATVRSAIR